MRVTKHYILQYIPCFYLWNHPLIPELTSKHKYRRIER
jgi:hypothetical protein